MLNGGPWKLFLPITLIPVLETGAMREHWAVPSSGRLQAQQIMKEVNSPGSHSLQLSNTI